MNGYKIQSIRNLYSENKKGSSIHPTNARIIETRQYFILQSFFTIAAAVRKNDLQPLDFGYFSKSTTTHQREFFSQLLGIDRSKIGGYMKKYKKPKTQTAEAIRRALTLEIGCSL